MASSCRSGEKHADLQVFVGQLGYFRHAVGDEDGVVGDALKERGGASVHGEHRGLEAGFFLDVEILKICERRYVARHNLVADELLELGIRNLERGVDLVAGLILRGTRSGAGAADVVHGARKPGVLDGHEIDVGAGDGGEFGRQMRNEVFDGERIEVGDDSLAQSLDRGHGRDALEAPGVDGFKDSAGLRCGVSGAAEQLGDALALDFWA